LLCFEQLFLQHFAEVRMRTANKDADKSQLNQYLFKIPADFPIQCSDACLAPGCEKTSRTSTARFRTMHQRHWSCQWEATLAGSYNFPPEFPDTQATAVSNKVSVVLPATTLVNDNSDDKPRRLPLYVNSLSSCATRHRVGNRLLLMASADHQGH